MNTFSDLVIIISKFYKICFLSIEHCILALKKRAIDHKAHSKIKALYSMKLPYIAKLQKSLSSLNIVSQVNQNFIAKRENECKTWKRNIINLIEHTWIDASRNNNNTLLIINKVVFMFKGLKGKRKIFVQNCVYVTDSFLSHFVDGQLYRKIWLF